MNYTLRKDPFFESILKTWRSLKRIFSDYIIKIPDRTINDMRLLERFKNVDDHQSMYREQLETLSNSISTYNHFNT